MKKAYTLQLVSVILAASILFAGCASSTLIQSSPPGAKVYIDGEPAGVTPCWYTDTKITGSITDVDLVKEGYEPFYTSFTRTEQVNVGAIIGGFFFMVPFLWTMEYKPTHNYELVPLRQQPQQIPEEVLTPSVTEPQLKQAEQPEAQPVSSKANRLRELKKLLDEKLINNADFEKQKQKILDEK